MPVTPSPSPEMGKGSSKKSLRDLHVIDKETP